MANYTFGDINGVGEGDHFPDRKALRSAGVHLALQGGIDGNPRDGSPSIVLNGGFVDDEDLGDVIIYTGHGGNNPNNGRQIADQTWDATGNKALLVSEMKGLPVRVTRGHRHKSPYSPSSGYTYGGLYRITDHFEQKGKDGFTICRYKLEKVSVLIPNEEIENNRISEGTEESRRVSTTTLRIVRDTKLSKEIKELYDYTCQVCGTRISVRGVPYAEGAHIRPLGKPHNGKDHPGNLLCLCPNHHVMLDKGIFSINADLTLIGLGGRLSLHKEHKLAYDNLDYHRSQIYINY
jgi:putative restriction endonuclease